MYKITKSHVALTRLGGTGSTRIGGERIDNVTCGNKGRVCVCGLTPGNGGPASTERRRRRRRVLPAPRYAVIQHLVSVLDPAERSRGSNKEKTRHELMRTDVPTEAEAMVVEALVIRWLGQGEHGDDVVTKLVHPRAAAEEVVIG